jgi:hypothetical protein
VVCDRVVAGVLLGMWMPAAADVVVKTRDWERLLRAFEAGRVRSMVTVLGAVGGGDGGVVAEEERWSRPQGPWSG